MSEGNRTPTRQFVEVGDVNASVESLSDGEDNLQSQMLEKNLLSSEFDRRINAIFTQLVTQIEMLIRSIRELSEGGSNRSTEGNVASERSRLSRLRSDNVFCITVHVFDQRTIVLFTSGLLLL